jgi:hypothetical protein
LRSLRPAVEVAAHLAHGLRWRVLGISHPGFRKLVLALLAASGVTLLVSFVPVLLAR